MSRFAPEGPGFTICTNNLTGTPNATLPGTGVPSGSSNADGTQTAILTNIAHEVCWLEIGLAGFGITTAEDNSCLLDILTDPAGGTSWAATPLITDLVCGFSPAPIAGRDSMAIWYRFPLYIPTGTSLGAQCRKTGVTSNTGQVVIQAYGRPRRPESWWCGSGVESLGINASTSKGTAVTPGSTGAYGTFASIGTSTYRYQYVQFMAQGNSNTVAAKGYYVQMGIGSVYLPGTSRLYMAGSTAEVFQRVSPGGIWMDIKAATALQLAATCNTASPDTLNGAIYGVF